MSKKKNYYSIIIVFSFVFFLNMGIVKASEPVENVNLETVEEIKNIPFDDNLKKHVQEVAISYSLEPALVMSVIERESSFQSGVYNGSHKGLMQVTAKWHQDRMDRLDCQDLYDPYQNIIVGTDLLSELTIRYDNCLELALMAYNMGSKLAEENYENGIITPYATSIINKIPNYK